MMMMNRDNSMMVVGFLLVSTLLSAVAATEPVSAYQLAEDLTRRLTVGESCGPVISGMLSCFFANCLELECATGVYRMHFETLTLQAQERSMRISHCVAFFCFAPILLLVASKRNHRQRPLERIAMS
jgi:hypothetical protein